jgi:hypothetical protein
MAKKKPTSAPQLSEEEKKDLVQSMETHIGELETRLGVHNGLLYSLLTQDDWSFVVKLHALIESSINELLRARVGRPELSDFLSLLPLSGVSGKLPLLQKLGLLYNYEVGFLGKISNLRNRMTHNIKNVDRTIADVLATMKVDEVSSFRDSFLNYLQRPVVEKAFNEGEFKGSILLVVVLMLTGVYAKIRTVEAEHEIAFFKAMQAHNATKTPEQPLDISMVNALMQIQSEENN